MKVTIRTIVGIWTVRASASISLNPDRFEEGEGAYIFEHMECKTSAGVSVLELLTAAQREGLEEALIEEWHEAKDEAAEYRAACQFDEMKHEYAYA